MKNKKGITFGRIILYIVFALIFVTLIWTLALTYKALKNPNTCDPKIECDNSLRYQAPSNYYGSMYIDKAYLNFYRSNDVTYFYNDGLGNNIGNVDISFPFSDTSSSPDVKTLVSSIYSESTPVHTFSTSYVSYDLNVSHIGKSIKDLYDIASGVLYEDSYGDSEIINYFTYFNNYKTAALIIDCNIPINIFNFNFTGNCNSTFWILFKGDNGAIGVSQAFDNHRYNNTSLPSNVTSSSTYITQIIIPIWLTSNDSSIYFLDNHYSYANGWQSLLNDNNFYIDFTWDIYTQSSDWQDGYEDGYNAGVQAADSSLTDLNAQLNQEVNNLNGRIRTLESQITQQSNIINNLNIELEQLQTGQFTFKNFFFSLADVPFKTVHSVLGFEFFGINLFNFFVGILTALGIIWLIKKIL